MVLLKYNEQKRDYTIVNRQVAQVLLFFSMESPIVNEGTLHLAFVQLFQTAGPINRNSGMYKVRKLNSQFEVVEVETIERGVHLIPCYIEVETKMANGGSPVAIDSLTDFWLNNHIDLHMYNTIY